MATDRIRAALAEIKNQAATYSGGGFPHEGDCMGSLCVECGHCLHSVEICAHECDPYGGCAHASVHDPEVAFKRTTLLLVAVLEQTLTAAEYALEHPLTVEGRTLPIMDARNITDALAVLTLSAPTAPATGA